MLAYQALVTVVPDRPELRQDLMDSLSAFFDVVEDVLSRARTANYVALPVLLAAAVLGHNRVWGLLFLWWTILTLLTGQALLVFEINRDGDPVLFWAIVCLWAVSGLMMLAASLFPQYAHLMT